jgi:cytochrome c peroxidase
MPSSLRRFAGPLVVTLVITTGCTGAPASDAPPWERDLPLAPLPAAIVGLDVNLAMLPDPPTPARVRLGRWLFYDTRLSADANVACGTCHRPEYAFSNAERVATGVFGRRGARKVPPVLNLATALSPAFFRDGRAASLETQAFGPITHPDEMGMSRDGAVAAVAAVPGYRRAFAEAFGDETVTDLRVSRALADFERTLLAGNSPWDRWRAAPRAVVVSRPVAMGDEVFFGKGGCTQCHVRQSFSDGRFHNIGVGWDPRARRFADAGRGGVTKRAAEIGAFKTPTLRDVALRAPYMHDGSVATLRDVVELYNRGGVPNPGLSERVKPLGLTTTEIDAVVAFLEALTSDVPRAKAPATFPQE